MFGEQRPFIIQYYLVDDTVEVREVHNPNDGRDPFPLFLKRQRVPKDRDNVDDHVVLVSPDSPAVGDASQNQNDSVDEEDREEQE